VDVRRKRKKKMPMEWAFHFSKVPALGEGKVRPGKGPLGYPRNFVPVLMKSSICQMRSGIAVEYQ
jgi:hypothetical protein